MKYNFSLAIVSSFLLILFANSAQTSKVPAAAVPDLKCYVCDDCATINSNTPVVNCDADYFRDTSTTTMTTVEDFTTSTEESTESSTTETTESSSSSSSTMTTDSTTEESTTVSESTTEESSSTTEGSTTPKATTMPTPPTIGPEVTTTPMPTPPNPGYAAAISDTVIQKVGAPGAPGAPGATGAFGAPGAPAEQLERQRREVDNSPYTYHCYAVQNTVNGSQVTERGCARVTTMQSVCGQLEVQIPNIVEKTCNPCSMSLCNSNSSSALNVSVLAIVMGILATLFRRN